MKTTLKYTSKCTAKSLWQEYRIYNDHLEFGTLFGNVIIPFEQIENTSVMESEIKGLLHGDLHLKNFRPALKLDWANFNEHVVLDKSAGNIKRVLFTPDDPTAFTMALNDALKNFRSSH